MARHFFTAQQIDIIRDIIVRTTQYTNKIRTLFFSDVNVDYYLSIPINKNPEKQLNIDLNELNTNEPLTDGSLPFYAWLKQASKYVKANADDHREIETLISRLENQTPAGKISPIKTPSEADIANIIKEKIVHTDDMLSYGFLEAGYKAGISVARLNITRYENEKIAISQQGSEIYSSGTGWLLTNDLLITNYHVVEVREEHEPRPGVKDFKLQATSCVAEFDYNAENYQNTIRIKVKEIVASDLKLDYLIFRLDGALDRLLPQKLAEKNTKEPREPAGS